MTAMARCSASSPLALAPTGMPGHVADAGPEFALVLAQLLAGTGSSPAPAETATETEGPGSPGDPEDAAAGGLENEETTPPADGAVAVSVGATTLAALELPGDWTADWAGGWSGAGLARAAVGLPGGPSEAVVVTTPTAPAAPDVTVGVVSTTAAVPAGAVPTTSADPLAEGAAVIAGVTTRTPGEVAAAPSGAVPEGVQVTGSGAPVGDQALASAATSTQEGVATTPGQSADGTTPTTGAVATAVEPGTTDPGLRPGAEPGIATSSGTTTEGDPSTGAPPTAAAATSATSAPATAATTSTTTSAPPVAPREVLAQVTPAVARLATLGEGVHRLTMQLNPRGLGDVRVVLTVRQGAVHVRLAAGEQARAALSGSPDDLVRALEQAGFREHRISLATLGAEPATTLAGAPGSPGVGDDGVLEQHAGTAGRDHATPHDQHPRTGEGSRARDGSSNHRTGVEPTTVPAAPHEGVAARRTLDVRA